MEYGVDIEKSMSMPSLLRQAIILKKQMLAGAEVDFDKGEYWFGKREVIPQAGFTSDGHRVDVRKSNQDPPKPS